MLDENGIPYETRDCFKEPLSVEEIRSLLKLLGVSARDVLRRNDPAFKELGLTGEESEARLVGLMAEHPGLLQRPIGIKGKRAVIGRPVERLASLF